MIYKNKLEPKLDGFVFVGNDHEMKTYKLYYPQFQKVHIKCESRPRTLVQNNGEFMGSVQEVHEFLISKEMIRSYSNYNFYCLIEGNLPMGLTWCMLTTLFS
jgi:hypothetical protein